MSARDHTGEAAWALRLQELDFTRRVHLHIVVDMVIQRPTKNATQPAHSIVGGFVLICSTVAQDNHRSRLEVLQWVVAEYLGVDDASAIYGRSDFCIPRGVTVEQKTKVVAQFVATHPADLHRPFIVVALAALRDAWPCQV
jgi:hypothetical protein